MGIRPGCLLITAPACHMMSSFRIAFSMAEMLTADLIDSNGKIIKQRKKIKWKSFAQRTLRCFVSHNRKRTLKICHDMLQIDLFPPCAQLAAPSKYSWINHGNCVQRKRSLPPRRRSSWEVLKAAGKSLSKYLEHTARVVAV